MPTTNEELKLMVRCPECKKENYAMMVAANRCAWCGYSPDDEPKKEETCK